MRIVHFEIPADDPARCIDFYSRTFGWAFEKWDGPMEYWMVKTGHGPGIDGGLTRRAAPGQGPANIVDVPAIDETIAAVTRAGGRVVSPKMAVPGVGWLAYFTDPEGNAFGAMQSDPGAR